MPCLEYYSKRYLLIRGCALEEESEKSFHSSNNSSFFLFLLHYLVYAWYFYDNLDISVLQVVSEPFRGPVSYNFSFSFQVTVIWSKYY